MPTEPDPPQPHFRASARRSVNLPATVVLDDEGTSEHPARLVNLGLGGACIGLSAAIARGAQAELVLEAPQLWEPLRVRATVAWVGSGSSADHVGLRFDQLSPTTLRAIAELLEPTLFG